MALQRLIKQFGHVFLMLSISISPCCRRVNGRTWSRCGDTVALGSLSRSGCRDGAFYREMELCYSTVWPRGDVSALSLFALFPGAPCKIHFVLRVSLQCGAREQCDGMGTCQPVLTISPCPGGLFIMFYGWEMWQLMTRGLWSQGEEG